MTDQPPAPRQRPTLKDAVDQPVIDAATVPTVEESKVEDTTYKVLITVVETYETEEQAVKRYSSQFHGGGENKIVVMKGNKVLFQNSWGYYADTHGQKVIDGQKYRIRFVDEER